MGDVVRELRRGQRLSLLQALHGLEDVTLSKMESLCNVLSGRVMRSDLHWVKVTLTAVLRIK